MASEAALRRLARARWLALLLITACGSAATPTAHPHTATAVNTSPSATATPTVVPTPTATTHTSASASAHATTSSRVSPTAVPAPRPCTAALLTARLRPATTSAGSAITWIALRNGGTAACTLQGFPALTVYDGAGHRLALTIGNGTTGGSPQVVTLKPGEPALGQGVGSTGYAYVYLQWQDNCSSSEQPQPVRWQLSPPGSTQTLTTDSSALGINSHPICGDDLFEGPVSATATND